MTAALGSPVVPEVKIYRSFPLNPSPSDLNHGSGGVLSSIDVKSAAASATWAVLLEVFRGRWVYLNSFIEGFRSSLTSWKAIK